MSNLIKQLNFHNSSDNARVIDMNQLAQEKIAQYQEKMKKQAQEENTNPEDTFVSGLFAERLDVDAILQDGDTVISAEELAGITEDQETTQDGFLDESQAQAFMQDIEANAREILEQAESQAQEIINQAMEEANRQREAIFAAARDEGYQAGSQEAARQLEEQSQQLEQQASQLEQDYTRAFEELEPMFVEEMSSIFDYVFGTCLCEDKNILLHLIDNTLRRIDSTKTYLVHVSSEDYPFVSEQKDLLKERVLLPESSLEIVEDFSLGTNDCMIETDGGIFDCGLGTELQELMKKLRLLSYEKGR